MQRTRRVLNVFLASPSDVNSERAMADDVVATVNRLVRLLGWQIDLHKWEDTSPGFGRPQAKINPMVDECDLFIGLLWQRWGQPSGEFSSGFEEEYERARTRRKNAGTPEIWLVFKEVDPDKVKDPGDQLKKVLTFQKTQEDLHEVLFQQVRDTEDWKNRLQVWLLEHVIRLASPAETAQQQPTAAPAFESTNASAIESGSADIDQPITPPQLKSIAALLNRTVQAGNLEFSSTVENPLGELEVVRLFLLSATLMTQRYTQDLFGTHEVNLAYKIRKQLDLTRAEEYQLLRTFIADKGDLQPGWFWFQNMQEETVRDVLLMLTSRDSSDDVRIRALDLLKTARIKIPHELWPALPFEHDSLPVRDAALSYLGEISDEKALPVLDALASDDDPMLNSAIRNSKLHILARLQPERFVSEALENEEYFSDDQLQLLEKHISEATEHALLKGIEHSSANMRKLALKELVRRKSMSLKIAQECTKNEPSLEIRAIAFQWLAEQGSLPDFETVRMALTEEGSQSRFVALAGLLGKTGPDVDSIIVSYYRTQPTEKLLELIDWFDSDGRLAYRALALYRFDVMGPDLRADLKDGFERIKNASIEKIRRQYGKEGTDLIAKNWDKLHDFVRSQFAESALLGLAENAQVGDAVLARPYLENAYSSVREAAVSVLMKIGEVEDVASLLKIAKEGYSDVKTGAAAAALRLSSSPVETARELIDNKSSEVAQIAFNWMFAQESAEVRQIFEELVNSQDDGNRVRALYYLSSRMNATEIEQFLNEYLTKQSYFYNVVTWLDRLLYSPLILRGIFVKELERQATK